ncbi:IS256 family transposase, partial [Bifidobacterium sp. SMA15]|nr:IS256 family transposase [Bifidobacterium platyrrhinorum]
RACEWVCYMKSGSPDPASLIRPEHWKPPVSVHARDKGGDDSSKPYDDGIQANNHDDPANEPGFYIRKGHVR